MNDNEANKAAVWGRQTRKQNIKADKYIRAKVLDRVKIKCRFKRRHRFKQVLNGEDKKLSLLCPSKTMQLHRTERRT